MKKSILLAALIMSFAAAAFADIAAPPEKPVKNGKAKGVSATMSIKLDRDATEARLLIPRSQIKQLRAELEQLGESEDNNAGLSRVQTIMSGALLSLAFIFGGILFLRSGKAAGAAGKSLVILAVIAGLGTAATLIYANVGPPPSARSITSRLFDRNLFKYYGFAIGKVKVEATDDTRIQLIVPDDQGTPGGEE